MIFPLFFILIFGTLDASFTAKVDLSSATVHVDEPLYVDLSLTYLSDYHTNKDELVGKLLGQGSLSQPPFSFISSTLLEKSVSAEGIVLEKFRFELDPQVIGDHFLSFFAIPFYPNGEGNKMELVSPVFRIQVIKALIAPEAIAFPAPLLNFSTSYPFTPNLFNQTHFMHIDPELLAKENLFLKEQKELPWVNGGVLFLILLTLWVGKSYKHVETVEEKAMRIRKEAFKTLEEMKRKGLTKPSDFESYYVHLIDSVRFYLEECYSFRATRETTREFLTDLDKNQLLSESLKGDLREFLVRADLVKFARYTPSKEECQLAEVAWKRVLT